MTVSLLRKGCVMEVATERYDALLRSGARRLTGHQRRLFIAEGATELCAANSRQAQVRFCWGRGTGAERLHEARLRLQWLENFSPRRRRRREEKKPPVGPDIPAL